MKKLFLFLFFLNLTFAQVNTSCNLVTNGDFEQNNGQLPNYLGQIALSTGWFSTWYNPANLGNPATPDYYHQSSPAPNTQIPCNHVGYQNSISGNAYAGMLIMPNNLGSGPYYETIGTQLSTSLLPNTNYKLSFYVSLAEGASNLAVKFQAYFSNALITIPSWGNLPITNSSMLFTNSTFSTTTNGWEKITFNFTTGSQAGEQYLYLGGLHNVQYNTITPASQVGGCNYYIYPQIGSVGDSYYYIDNVELSRVIDPPLINLQTAICKGSSATLSVQNPQNGLVYSWYSSSTSSVVLGTGNSFTTPNLTSNTSYWVEAYDSASGCKSVRVQKLITVGLPSVGNKKMNLCQGLPSFTLSVAPTIPNGTIKWYSSPTGSTALLAPPTISTSSVGNIVYYFSQTNGICESSRSAYSITINTLPPQPLVQTETSAVNYKHICKIRPQILYAYPVLSGAKYYWSAPANSGVSINSNPNNEYALFTFNPNLIVNGSTIPITLTIENESGCRSSNIITLEVYPNVAGTNSVTVPLGDVSDLGLTSIAFEQRRGLLFDANQFEFITNNLGNNQSLIFPPYNLNNKAFIYKTIALSSNGNTNDMYHFVEMGKNGCHCNLIKYTVLPQNISSKSSSEDIKSTVKIYPNPAKTTITIDGIEQGNTIEIYDLQGKLLFTKDVESIRETIDVSQFANGIYLAKIINKNQEVKTVKFVVER